MMDYWIVIYRTIFFYVLIVILYRIMGKREVGELSVIDLIVSISMAQLAAISIETLNEPFYVALIPILFLFVIQMLVAFFSLKYDKFRTFFDGRPTVIIERGKIKFKSMVKERYNLEDLLTQLREKGIRSIDEVEYAILESNGTLSVFKYNILKLPSHYPMPLILDGKVQKETLKVIGKTQNWLDKVLKEQQVVLDNVFYAFYKGKKLYIINREKLN
jgi:uncharacterized membrane protein YcaP (DUF421 family)